MAATGPLLYGIGRARQGAGRGRRGSPRIRARAGQAAPDRGAHEGARARRLNVAGTRLMTRKQRRLVLIGSAGCVLGGAGAPGVAGLQDFLLFFYFPPPFGGKEV